MPEDIRLTPPQVSVRLLPFLAVAWTRASLAIVIPGFIATFDLSIAEAGRVVMGIEIGSFATMIVLAFAMDRLGPGRVMAWGLPVLGLALLATSLTTTTLLLPVFLLAIGAGIALSASASNTLMASTGRRRTIYLGWLHMSFSGFSLVVPLVAGYIVAAYDWQTFYQVLAVIAILILLGYRAVEGTGRRQTATVARMQGAGEALRRNLAIYLGVFFLVGVQGILMSWSYMYAIDRHGVEHAAAAVAPASVWLGVLAGRAANIAAARRFTLKTIMVASCLLTMIAFMGEYLLSSYWATLTAFAGVGFGVSGAFQHGTAWSSERTPGEVGAASTFVMAAAALGVGVWPWLVGLAADAFGFASMTPVAMAGLLLALASFAAAGPAPRRPAGIGEAGGRE